MSIRGSISVSRLTEIMIGGAMNVLHFKDARLEARAVKPGKNLSKFPKIQPRMDANKRESDPCGFGKGYGGYDLEFSANHSQKLKISVHSRSFAVFFP